MFLEVKKMHDHAEQSTPLNIFLPFLEQVPEKKKSYREIREEQLAAEKAAKEAAEAEGHMAATHNLFARPTDWGHYCHLRNRTTCC